MANESEEARRIERLIREGMEQRQKNVDQEDDKKWAELEEKSKEEG